MPVTCGFDDWRDAQQLNRQTPLLTVADHCIWHDSGTNLSRRQPATMVGAPTGQARVCLGVPPPALATLLLAPSTRATRDGRPRDDGRELSAWEAAGI